MKINISLLVLLLTIASLAYADKVNSGEIMKTIYVPSNSGRAMNFAAGELSKYLKQMTGHEFSVIQGEADNAPGIHLGLDTSITEDGYRITSQAGQIRIFGGGSRGCLYGAYAFLHDLGCRWPLPGKANEVVPKIDRIEWSGKEIKHEPAIRRRGMLMASRPVEPLIDYVDFLAKNGFNFVFLYLTSNMSEDLMTRLASAMGDREMGLDYGGHWLPGLLPRDLFKEHPEYFRMENGKRTNDLNMCASSPEAIEIMAKNLQPQIDSFKDFTRFETLHLWADDIFGGGDCSCEKCKDLSGSDQLLKIVNDLTEKLELGDDLKIADIAYHGSVYPPTKIKASKNLRLMFAGRERCYRHALDGCDANRRYLEYLKGNLKAMPDGSEVFDYLQDLILFRFMAVPLHPIIGKDAKIYKDTGVDGVFAHAFETYSDWAYGPNAYILGKALWRGEGDTADMDEYCTAVYGPVGRSMKQYFDMLYDLTTTAMETCGYSGFADMRYPPIEAFNKEQAEQLKPLVTDEHLNKVEGKLREALNVGREPYRSRVEDQLRIWRYTRSEVKAIYRTIDSNSRETELQALYGSTAEVPSQVRDEMIGRYDVLTKELDANTKMITTSPERLRGWYGESGNGAVNERGEFGYAAVMKARLTQWQNRPVSDK
ncbi:MAG: DUF4838 domain-containing protein [Armatimonadota bacterium]